jgi:hypothetical protein
VDLKHGGAELHLAHGQLFFTDGEPDSGFTTQGLFAVPAGATAGPIGIPCAESGPLPDLMADHPVGSKIVPTLTGAVPNRTAMLFRGAPSKPLELGSGCTAYLNLGSLALLGIATTDATGAATFPALPIPNDPALASFRTVIQSAVGPTPTEPLALELSNAVLFTLDG